MITEKVFFKQNAIKTVASSKTERDAGVVRSNDLFAGFLLLWLINLQGEV
jgi:hypothetical protein